jgi:hypothetical protein
MFVDSVLHCSIIFVWDATMNNHKKKNKVPDEIPIIWVNVI